MKFKANAKRPITYVALSRDGVRIVRDIPEKCFDVYVFENYCGSYPTLHEAEQVANKVMFDLANKKAA